MTLPALDMAALKIFNDRMHAVFALVDPRTHALRAAARGEMQASVAAKTSWRDRIAVVVTDSELAAIETTIGEVERAITYMTATNARSTHYSKADNGKGGIEPGWVIIADGYRAGPAGDH